MRLGVMAYSTKTGLGYQTKDYVDHLKPTKIMEVDLSAFNGMQQHNWYEGSYKVRGYPSDQDIKYFLRDLDVVLFAETPLNYNFYSIARSMGIKTAVVPNWEFFDHIARPELPLPDLFIMPSVWHYDDALSFAEANGVKCIQLHHPVDRKKLHFQRRTQARFMHVAGKPAANDRNGTWDFLNACPDGTIVTQSEDLAYQVRRQYRNSKVYTGIDDQNMMYSMGSVMVLPRRYGGNCLPLNEALACGMPVIMPDISPNNNILPKEWLVPATFCSKFTPRTTIDMYDIDVSALVDKINWFRSIDIAEQSDIANKIADSISWDALKDKYVEALESL